MTQDEQECIEASISAIVEVRARHKLVSAGQPLMHSTLLLKGILCRYIDDSHGLRQLVAIHLPGDFVDLHGYPLKTLEHDIASVTPVTVAHVSHEALDKILSNDYELARKFWFATLLDAAIHRAWLFRLGRLDAQGRIAHFLCETNARLICAGLSNGVTYSLPITQTDLAEICGLTPIHVNRVLRILRLEGLCTFRDGTVTIQNASSLAALGEFDPEYLYIDRNFLAIHSNGTFHEQCSDECNNDRRLS